MTEIFSLQSNIFHQIFLIGRKMIWIILVPESSGVSFERISLEAIKSWSEHGQRFEGILLRHYNTHG